MKWNRVQRQRRACPARRRPRNWSPASRSCQLALNRHLTRYSSSTLPRSLASFALAAVSGSGGARSPGKPSGGLPACMHANAIPDAEA